MNIIVDYDRCEGHGECVIAAPEVFDLNDDGDEVVVLDDTPAEALLNKVETAAKLCPVAALRIAR
ncbi:ferredoxin [Nocardia mikamii]|uniref:ferredoxin n=1 Tax=Nocardia mikamii TaxID=508464 RepID=UPI0007A43039|nr:ferredoxin [Nocardia mikamii]